jgi:quercetin 2,3-dioxygenase
MMDIRKSQDRGHFNHGWLDTYFTFSFADYYDPKHVHFRTLRPGDVQYMSAGSGVTHSEFNASKTEPVHLLQIWMFPEEKGLQPVYGQKNFSAEEKRGKLRLVASPDGRDGSVKIRQDNELYVTLLDKGEAVKYQLKPERHAYIQVARGSVQLNGTKLEEGDGAALSKEKAVELTGVDNAEVLLFDLA